MADVNADAIIYWFWSATLVGGVVFGVTSGDAFESLSLATLAMLYMQLMRPGAKRG